MSESTGPGLACPGCGSRDVDLEHLRCVTCAEASDPGACTCPHAWTNTPPDLTAAGNQGPSTRTWTRMLTVWTCPEHGSAKEDRHG